MKQNRKHRYLIRNSSDGLVSKILNLSLFDSYEFTKFQEVPDKFDDFEKYLSIWNPLFMQE